MAKSAAYMKQKTPNGVQTLYSSLWGATPDQRWLLKCGKLRAGDRV